MPPQRAARAWLRAARRSRAAPEPRTGRTDSWLLTGLPGKQITGRPRYVAVACGPPGCMATAPTQAPSGSSRSRTTSWSPIETPPLVSSSSAPASMAASNRARELLGVVAHAGALRRRRLRRPRQLPAVRFRWSRGSRPAPGAGPGRPTRIPCSRRRPARATARPPRRGPTRRGPRAGATRAALPAPSSSAPAARSEPASRTYSPTSRVRRIVTASPSTVVSSTGTTASAPGGIGAPVMIRVAVPGASAGGSPGAAATSPTIGRATGAAATSAARTAKPSIWELRNGGRSMALRMASAVALPCASSSGRLSAAPRSRSGASSAATRSACSSTVTRSPISFRPPSEPPRHQYRLIPGSTDAAHSSIPPARCDACEKPLCSRNTRACADRTPRWQ